MGEWIQLKSSDGFEFSAWREAPEGRPRGGVIVIQEIFGVNHHIRSVVHRFAASGFVAVAPALFDRLEPSFEAGYDDASRARAFQLMGKFDRALAVEDIAAAIPTAAAGGKVGVVGFCLGGLLAWATSAHVPGVAAAVGYYGNITALEDLKPKAATLMHFGEKDQHIPVDKVREVAAGFPEVEFYYYPADHGFGCDERASFDAESSTIAWGRTIEFLVRHSG